MVLGRLFDNVRMKEKGKPMITIHREGMCNMERAVRITGNKGHSYYINPVSEVFHATGASLGRTGCIISFAEGLVAAGHKVWMDRRFLDRPISSGPFISEYPPIAAFFLVGLAWGKETWPSLKASLKIIDPAFRFRVFEYTAFHYGRMPRNLSGGLPRPYADKILLQIPSDPLLLL